MASVRGRRQPASLKLLKSDNKAHTVRWKKQSRDDELRIQVAAGPLDPTPPEYMTPEEGEVYREVIRIAHKDVLCAADAPIIELTARLLYKFRTTDIDDIHPNMITRLMGGLDKLGMTPVARGKVAAAARKEKDKDDPLNEFVA